MSSDPPAPLVNPNQDRLKSHFESHAPAAHGKRWDDLWAQGSFLPWDRGHANPALVDALNERADILGSPLRPDGSRKRALVPGCGKGYDVALFAAHGYDSFGIEVSENAVRVAEEYLQDPGPGPLEGEYKVKDEKVGRGTARCVLGDFFEDGDGWVKETGGLQGGFDIIYDNTFLCALDPTMRPAWARRMHQLLASTGVLVCLEFPTHKPPKSGGPPYALPSVVHEELFKRPGEDIAYDEGKKPLASDREAVEKTLVRVAHWKPHRTHQVGVIKGEVTDRVSLWKHRGA